MTQFFKHLPAIIAAALVLVSVQGSAGLVTQSGPRLFVEGQVDDTTPNAFTFTDQSGVSTSSTITSAAITVSGIDAATAITVSGGTYDVNASGSFTSSSGTVSNGDTVRARHTSSASNSTATNTVVTIGGVSDTFTSTTEASAGGGAPTPESTGGTVVWDMRAGGDQSIQAASTITQVENYYSAEYVRWRAYTNDGGSAPTTFLETNVDGSNTKARGIQWQAAGASPQEQQCALGIENTSQIAPNTGFYTSFKTRFGKFASGSGLGTGPNSLTFAGGNPHIKLFIWNRRNDGGDRVYIYVGPNDTSFKIDDLGYNSANWTVPGSSTGLYGLQDQVISITVYIQPTTGTIRAWVNDTQVQNQTGQNIGTSPLLAWQETVTAYLANMQQIQYFWDLVIWYP